VGGISPRIQNRAGEPFAGGAGVEGPCVYVLIKMQNVIWNFNMNNVSRSLGHKDPYNFMV